MTVRRSLWVLETGFSPESGSVTLQPEDRLPEADQADMQKRVEASPDDGDALAPTFAQTVAPEEMEEEATKTTSSCKQSGGLGHEEKVRGLRVRRGLSHPWTAQTEGRRWDRDRERPQGATP